MSHQDVMGNKYGDISAIEARLAELEQEKQQLIELRKELRNPRPTVSNQRLRLAAGLDVSEEAGREASSTTSSELVLNGSIDWYRFSSPELDLTSSVSIFPSLTEKGRVRAKADLRLRWEIYDDLFWDLTFYDDYDNQPTRGENAEGSGSNDYGITTGLGWSW